MTESALKKPNYNDAATRVTALVVCLAFWNSVGAQSPGTPSTMIYEGFTESKHDIMVAAMELGRIESIDVEAGDVVRAGQVIGKLEDALQAESVKLARLQAAMTGELNATKAEVDLNRSRAEQLRILADDGMARPDELVRAEADLRIATARHAAAIEQSEQRKVELRRKRTPAGTTKDPRADGWRDRQRLSSAG